MGKCSRYPSEQVYYETTWREGKRGFDPYQSVDAVMEVLRSEAARPGRTLLDVGCGAGKYAVAAAKLGFRTTGVDFSPSSLRLARQYARREGVSRRVCLVESDVLVFRGEHRFDVIVDSGCLHHIRKRLWPQYLAMIANHMHEDTTYVLYCISKNSTFRSWNPSGLKRSWTTYRGHYTHCFTAEEIEVTFSPMLHISSMEEIEVRPRSFRYVAVMKPK